MSEESDRFQRTLDRLREELGIAHRIAERALSEAEALGTANEPPGTSEHLAAALLDVRDILEAAIEDVMDILEDGA